MQTEREEHPRYARPIRGAGSGVLWPAASLPRSGTLIAGSAAKHASVGQKWSVLHRATVGAIDRAPTMSAAHLRCGARRECAGTCRSEQRPYNNEQTVRAAGCSYG